MHMHEHVCLVQDETPGCHKMCTMATDLHSYDCRLEKSTHLITSHYDICKYVRTFTKHHYSHEQIGGTEVYHQGILKAPRQTC